MGSWFFSGFWFLGVSSVALGMGGCYQELPEAFTEEDGFFWVDGGVAVEAEAVGVLGVLEVPGGHFWMPQFHFFLNCQRAFR